MSFLVKIVTTLFVSNKKRYIFVKEITIKKNRNYEKLYFSFFALGAFGIINFNFLVMKIYKVEVWFRYVSNGEQEKDFDTHEIIANSFEQAAEKALQHYNKISNCIPFATKNVTP